MEAGEAGDRVARVMLDVGLDHRLDQVAKSLGEDAAAHENFTQRTVFLQNPGVHPLDQRIAGDEIQLECDDAEEKISVGRVAVHGGAPRGRNS